MKVFNIPKAIKEEVSAQTLESNIAVEENRVYQYGYQKMVCDKQLSNIWLSGQ